MQTNQTLSGADKVDGQTMPVHLSVSATAEWIQTAAALTDQGRAQDAVDMLAPLEPGAQDPEFYYELGRACRATGDLMMAMKSFDRAIEMGWKTAELFNEVGMTLERFGHPELATQSLLQALTLAPEEPVLLYNLATILTGLSRFEDAKKACEMALHYAPDLFPAAELLAQLRASHPAA